MLALHPISDSAGPLIHERDLFMAWTLKRSRAVCGQRRVVGVVGRGHLAGVMRALASDRGGDTLVSLARDRSPTLPDLLRPQDLVPSFLLARPSRSPSSWRGTPRR